MHRFAAQRHRMNRVANFAQRHLAEALDLDRLAEVACLSKFHFTRVFTDHYQETPIQYLWRIRLERAARGLVFLRHSSITDIAMDCGFSSSQTFSRAFRQRFSIAPRTVRSARLGSFAGLLSRNRPMSALRATAVTAPEARWERSRVRIEGRPGFRVAYIRHIGPYWDVDGGISSSFVALERWARAQSLWDSASALIGICPDNSAVTAAGHCLYDTCIPVPSEVTEDDVVSIQTIPAGTFAVLRVSCTAAEMENAWAWLTSTWLPSSGLTCALVHSYEAYPLVHGRRGGPKYSVELCLSLGAD